MKYTRKMFICLAIPLLLVWLQRAVLGGALPLHVPQIRLPLMKSPPTIDGTVSEDEWAGAARMERFCGADGVLSPQEGSFWVGCDGRELFIAVVSATPPGGKILSRVTSLPENADARTWMDDSIEMVIDPLHADTSGRRRLYHANINALGAINDTAYSPTGGGEAWRGHWRTASKVIGDRWHFEAALPLADMNVTAADLAKPFGIRVVRNWQQYAVGPQQTEWSPLGGAYLGADTLPLVTWDQKAPVVQVLRVRDPEQLLFNTRVVIRNPHDVAVDVVATIKSVPNNSAHSLEKKSLSVPAEGTQTIELIRGSVVGESVYTSVDVTSADASTIYYSRDFVVKLEQPDPLWLLDEDAGKKIDVSFAYYPYHDTIKAIVNVNGLEEKEKVSGVSVRVRAAGGREIASATMPPLRDFTTTTEWKIPPLSEGSYEFVTELQGIKVDAVVTSFVRHVFEWEHNPLGKSDIVAPPFTPIQVDGTKVGTILRTHTMNDVGLWDQVESDGKPLLKSPMRIDVKSGGKTARMSGSDQKFVQQTATRVLVESNLSAAEIAGTARSEWDYDGMMKWTLDLKPSAAKVDSMTLVIPLNDERMPLLHACTDGVRFNYAGATPPGQGRVWDGSKAARNSIIGSYVPYIWLGAEERGLAVFGDNDRGWARSPDVPCQELVRSADGTLELRLNLIAAATVLEQPRRIVIGFQATPTKPMPKGWRGWLLNAYHPKASLSVSFLGNCNQWGALTPYDDMYARDRDYTVYDKLAETRKSGTIDQAWVKNWMAATRLPNESQRDDFIRSLDYGFRLMSNKPQNVIVYTNPRGMRTDTEEGQTFLDEWHVDAFSSRKTKYGDGASYGATPVESLRDAILWHDHKMLAAFDDSVNWDNAYLKACFDTVGSDAYELSPGTIQPSVCLFDMRELIRRTAILNVEMKKSALAVNMPHTTNTAIAPIMSFASAHVFWEDRQGDADFQDRFSRDYIHAESIGRQHGSVPFALLLIKGTDPKKNAWAERTAAGVCLTHEIRAVTNFEVWRAAFFRLLDFGYARDDVRVFNYWQPRAEQPVRVEGSDVTTLIVAKPNGEGTMVIVCDYGNGGNITLNVDTAAIGLKPAFTARDAETGEKLPTDAAKVMFPLKRHDFRMIVLE